VNNIEGTSQRKLDIGLCVKTSLNVPVPVLFIFSWEAYTKRAK